MRCQAVRSYPVISSSKVLFVESEDTGRKNKRVILLLNDYCCATHVHTSLHLKLTEECLLYEAVRHVAEDNAHEWKHYAVCH